MAQARSLVVLLSDFGSDSPYVGAMKGALLEVHPGLALVDLTHAVPAQGVETAAWLLALHYRSFPAGSVFLAVVDPGVGSGRRALVARAGDYFCVAPDNGLLSGLVAREPDSEIRCLADESLWREPRSATFHGRDLFAPAAAWLAKGRDLAGFGPPCLDPCRLDLPRCRREAGVLEGRLLFADAFGNLISDVDSLSLARFCTEEHLAAADLRFEIGTVRIHGLVTCYAEAQPGEALALVGSSGQLEIAVNQGSAAEGLGLAPGQALRVSGARGRDGQGRAG